MTAEEVSRKYHISVDKIRFYEENGLLEHGALFFYENKRDKSGQIQILR